MTTRDDANHPRAEWRQQTAEGETDLPYWDWVAVQRELWMELTP